MAEPDTDPSDAKRDGDFLADEVRATISRCGKESPLTAYTVLGVLARISHEFNLKLDRIAPPP